MLILHHYKIVPTHPQASFSLTPLLMDELAYHYKYPHPAVTTDCVVFGYDGAYLSVLLIERGHQPCKGMWAFPGGFLNIDEDAEDGARRELMEETGLMVEHIRQCGTFATPDRDPRERVITIAFYALVHIEDVMGGDDAARACWFRTDYLPPLAFDHDHILHSAMSAMRQRAYFEPIGKGVLPDLFTIRELQQLYETVLDMKFSASTFRTQVLSIGLLTPAPMHDNTPDEDQAKLYCFSSGKYEELRLRQLPLGFLCNQTPLVHKQPSIVG